MSKIIYTTNRQRYGIARSIAAPTFEWSPNTIGSIVKLYSLIHVSVISKVFSTSTGENNWKLINYSAKLQAISMLFIYVLGKIDLILLWNILVLLLFFSFFEFSSESKFTLTEVDIASHSDSDRQRGRERERVSDFVWDGEKYTALGFFSGERENCRPKKARENKRKMQALTNGWSIHFTG